MAMFVQDFKVRVWGGCSGKNEMKATVGGRLGKFGLLLVMICLISAEACACLGIRNCIPLSIPIKNTSGEKFLSAEAKLARKTADLILRMDISGLLEESGYESEVVFAPVAEKYLLISPSEWKQEEESRRRTGVIVCEKAELYEWAEMSNGYRVKYRFRAALKGMGGWRPGELRLVESGDLLEVVYSLKKDKGRWKISEKNVLPNYSFGPMSGSKSYARWRFTRPRASEEWSSWAKAVYEQLEQAEAKHCK